MAHRKAHICHTLLPQVITEACITIDYYTVIHTVGITLILPCWTMHQEYLKEYWLLQHYSYGFTAFIDYIQLGKTHLTSQKLQFKDPKAGTYLLIGLLKELEFATLRYFFKINAIQFLEIDLNNLIFHILLK